MTIRSVIFSILLVMTLGACGDGAVVFAPTPLPPDVSPVTYAHPSGAISIQAPRDWSVHQQERADLATLSLTPPGMDQPALIASAVALAVPMETDALINQYQTAIRSDVTRYTEQSRTAMPDGSVRVVGLRQTLGNQPQTINTFFQRSDPVVGVLEVVMPQNTALVSELERAINTFIVNPDADITQTSLGILANASYTDIRIMNVNAWTTTLGVYVVTGEVANFGAETVGDIPVRVALQRADGAILVDAVDDVMGYQLAPGEFAPFSLRFGEGRPAEATRFSITLGNASWQPLPSQNVIGNAQISHTDTLSFSPEGHTLIQGTITNDSEATIRDPQVIITAFDAQRNVIAGAFTPTSEAVLEPGESADYFIRIQEIGGVIDGYIVDVQARIDE